MRRLAQFLLLTIAIVIVPLRCVWKYAAVMDADIWLRLRTGEWIAQNHALPHNGLFTQHLELPWIAYSWGFDLLSWAFFRGLGPNGLANISVMLIVLQALIAATLFVCLYKTSNRFLCSVGLTAAVLWAANSLSLRSLLLSILFYTVEICLLLAAERHGDAKKLWWLIPIFILWANVHIQFVYGLFVLGIFAVAMTAAHISSQRSTRILPPTIPPRIAWILFGACTLATLLNPYFFGVYRTIFSYAGNTTQYSQIIEYAAMNFRHPSHFIQLLLVLAAIYAIGWRHGFEPFRLLLLASTALVAFRSQRDGWFVCIAAGLMLAESLRRSLDLEKSKDEHAFWAVPVASFVAAVLIAYGVAAHQGLDQQTLIRQLDREYPVRSASFIAEKRLQGPLYNTYNWGEYLVFNLREYPVSIDGRTDLFGAVMDTRAMATVNAYDLEHDPDFQRAHVILLERFLPLASYLANDHRFKLVYSDHIAAVFIRVQ
jgi:hypothetical protein